MGADRWHEESQARLHESCTARIKALEQQCATLAVEIDRMRPVVEAAQRLVHLDVLFHAGELSRVSTALDKAVADYEATKGQK